MGKGPQKIQLTGVDEIPVSLYLEQREKVLRAQISAIKSRLKPLEQELEILKLAKSASS